jgi:hypothetical protein
VHAYKGKWKDYWGCSIVTQHTCHLLDVQKSHRNLTSQFVANEMYQMIVANLLFEPKSIIRHIQEKYKYTILYGKAWSAKQKVLEMRFGTFEAAYDNISRLLAVICQRNSRSYYDLKSLDRGQGPPSYCSGPFSAWVHALTHSNTAGLSCASMGPFSQESIEGKC